MDNPKTNLEKLDAASNYVAQIGIALNIRDINHAQDCQKKALKLMMEILMSDTELTETKP